MSFIEEKKLCRNQSKLKRFINVWAKPFKDRRKSNKNGHPTPSFRGLVGSIGVGGASIVLPFSIGVLVLEIWASCIRVLLGVSAGLWLDSAQPLGACGISAPTGVVLKKGWKVAVFNCTRTWKKEIVTCFGTRHYNCKPALGGEGALSNLFFFQFYKNESAMSPW